jgi:hypothetical protein
MTAFWDITLCSFVEVGRRFRGAYCPYVWAMNEQRVKSRVDIVYRNWPAKMGSWQDEWGKE